MTWTAPKIDRREPPENVGERETLQGFLDFHRDTLLLKCEGLTGEQLVTAAVESSTLTLLGLVRHLAEVERWWFRRCFSGMDIGDLFCTEEYRDGDFDLIDASAAEADFGTFATEVRLADEAVAGRDLADEFQTPRRETMNLRWVYVHMIEEYARHNGHADLIRERIDGVTGE